MGKNNSKGYYTIDVLHVFKFLLRKAWIIILCTLIAAAIGFSYSSFVVKPRYASSIMLYVNNGSFSLGNTNFSISSSEITAAQSLVKTYGEILNNRTTLERVIEKSGVSYNYMDLSKMIVSEPSNGTEIMKVTVTTHNADDSAKIANCIAEILPARISEIIDGASMEVIDSAIPNYRRVSPSVTNYTLMGILLGLLLSVVVLVVVAMLDDRIHDEEYILQNYDYPILAKVPDLANPGSKSYSYYSKRSDDNAE